MGWFRNPILKCLAQYFGSYLSSLMGWQHLVGVVQRNQPCLHGHPMCWIEVWSFGFVPFYHSEVIPLATVSVRVPFLFPLLPISFSPLLPTCIQLPQEQVAHTVLCFMFRLGSFLMLCNKQLPSNVLSQFACIFTDTACTHIRIWWLNERNFSQ